MHLKRARFANNIVAEFLPPRRPSNRVVIICDGLPSSPGKKRLVTWFARHGYWAFNLRYRGTWESGGSFLDHDPMQDVLDLIEGLPSGFKEAWSGETFKVSPEFIAVVGASFGGTTSLMASLDSRVNKVVALAPVIDWTYPSPDEPMDVLEQIINDGYGGAYRFLHDDWLKLSSGTFFQPKSQIAQFNPQKIFIAHALDDTMVPVAPTQKFVEEVGCRAKWFKTGGHLSSTVLMKWSLRKKILRFLAK
jgi:dipeptidyl aminopeptidase/acylaminoacyl peptidase